MACSYFCLDFPIFQGEICYTKMWQQDQKQVYASSRDTEITFCFFPISHCLVLSGFQLFLYLGQLVVSSLEFIWGEELRETLTISFSERIPDLFPLICRYQWALFFFFFVNTFRGNGFCLDLITDGIFSPPQGSSGLTSVGIWLLTWLGIFSVWLARMSAFLQVKDQVVLYCSTF